MYKYRALWQISHHAASSRNYNIGCSELSHHVMGKKPQPALTNWLHTIAKYTQSSTQNESSLRGPDDQPSCKRTVRVAVPSPTHSLDNRSYRTISDLQWEVTGMVATFTLSLHHDLLDKTPNGTTIGINCTIDINCKMPKGKNNIANFHTMSC